MAPGRYPGAMTDTDVKDAPARDDTDAPDEDVEVEALAADETPLATSQEAYLTEVKTWTEDERHGLWGQPLK